MSNYTAKVFHDHDQCHNPREWCNVGTMVCWHRNYTLGDEQPKCEPTEYEIPEGSEVLPLYLYDHSGITMSTGAFGCPWDSGQVGFIYVSPERIVKEWGDDSEASREKARECLKGEVKAYDQYITGDVWGFEIFKSNVCECCKHDQPESVECVGGFFGDCLDQMIDNAGDEYRDALTAAWEDRFSG